MIAVKRLTQVFGSLLLLGLLFVAVFPLPGSSSGKRDPLLAGKAKTICVGRFLIDLPEGMRLSRSQTSVDGFHINAYPEKDDAFWTRVAARQAEIEAKPNELRPRNLETAARIQVNGFDGKMFVFGRNASYMMDFGQRRVLEGVALEAHVHADGLSFDVVADDYNPALIANLPRLIGQLRRVAADAIPAEPGFCFGEGMFVDPLVADQGESTSIFVDVPGHPDVVIAFSTMAGTKPRHGLLERSARAAAREPLWMRAAFKTLREGKRSINGLAGEEVAVKVTELNLSTGFGLDWEMAGNETDVHSPFLHLEMETGRNPRAGGKPVQSSFGQTDVLELWDAISSSIRLRPSGPAGKVAPEALAARQP